MAAPKKSETIEIRLSHEAKTAFMERCRQEQQTASEAVRQFIDATIDPRPTVRQRRTSYWRVIAAGLFGAALGLGAAAPSLARAAHEDRAAFDQLDRNHDGVLSYREFQAR
jgi:branched-subunit amino acid aminotransferase/4-amino-4-deoxychorismate lyase